MVVSLVDKLDEMLVVVMAASWVDQWVVYLAVLWVVQWVVYLAVLLVVLLVHR